MIATDATPFVLLDDARDGVGREGAPARLYRDPARVIEIHETAGVLPALAEIRAATRAGYHAAGFLSYEAGAAFEPVLAPREGGATPLLWFGLFERYTEHAPGEVPALLPEPAGAWIGPPQPEVDRATYDAQLGDVFDLIEAGDLYQANLTYRATCRIAGDPLALYAQLRRRARAGYGALISTGREMLLSLSPELFFSLEGRAITCRPMKGTARRGVSPEEDRDLRNALDTSEKQRAENLMIVDLMRNDVSRVAGNVAVPQLFAVETYPTLHQMVSTVTAELGEGRDAVDVLAALFPCGSITGAPKIRAMQALADIEASPRGAYTGAIGRIDDTGDAMFNVAIRTLTIRHDDDRHAEFGAGGGIVADSSAGEEWDETLAKGAFLTAGQRDFDLIETMAFDPLNGLALLERHLARMKASADLFGFAFDRHATRNELQAATFRLRGASKVRLVLAKSGAIAIEVAPAPAPVEGMTATLLPLPVSPRDFRLCHKTSDRRFYGEARRAAGTPEAIFVDPQGFVTEGTFTNVFVERDGMLITPPLSRGLLPGVLRGELIESGRAIAGDIVPADLENGFLLGNALRGLFPATLAPNILAVAKRKRRRL